MGHRLFGRTGLQVSPVTLGSMEFGSKDQLEGQLAAFDAVIDTDLAKRIDEIVPPGSVTVPYYLDDSFADFRRQPYAW